MVELGKYYLVGSSYFFSCYPDYKTKDIDLVCFVEEGDYRINGYIRGRQFFGGNVEAFIYKNMSIEEYKKYKHKCFVGNWFLNREVASAFGLTIEDLKELKPYIDTIWKDHKEYNKMILDFYIQNNDFILTDEQRLQAYECYKKYRKDRYYSIIKEE